MMLFFRKISTTAVVAMVAVSPVGAADNATDRLMATRLQLACPEAEMVQLRGDHITWSSEPREVTKARRCLREAYRTFVADPFPVNMNGYCNATKVTVTERGTIVLSC